MNKKIVKKLKARLAPEKNNIYDVVGCYVTSEGRIGSTFREDLYSMPEDEQKMVYKLLKGVYSGEDGRSRHTINFSDNKEGNDAFNLLKGLVACGLRESNNALIDTFFGNIASLVTVTAGASENPTDYIILLVAEECDSDPFISKGETKLTDTYQYMTCAICPVKEKNFGLGYSNPTSALLNLGSNWIVSAPVMGFTYPEFAVNSENPDYAMYYSKDAKNLHDDFTHAVFAQAPMIAVIPETQSENFSGLLTETLGENCTLETVRAVKDNIAKAVAEDEVKENDYDVADGFGCVNGKSVCAVFNGTEVDQETRREFSEQFDKVYNGDSVPRCNLMQTKGLKVTTADVTITAKAESEERIETRVIDGVKYILVRADDTVTVNGINVEIN